MYDAPSLEDGKLQSSAFRKRECDRFNVSNVEQDVQLKDGKWRNGFKSFLRNLGHLMPWASLEGGLLQVSGYP